MIYETTYNNCACGKSHVCPIDYIVIEHDALKSLRELCEGYSNILMVSDQNTYRVCGKEFVDILGAKITSDVCRQFQACFWKRASFLTLF